MLRYVELKTGFGDNGPASVGHVKLSKSRRTVYFKRLALKRASGGPPGNHVDLVRRCGKYATDGAPEREGTVGDEVSKTWYLTHVMRPTPHLDGNSAGLSTGYNSGVHTTIEAKVDDQGVIRPLESVSLRPGARVLVTVLEPEAFDTALASESALAADWNRPEEDAAWADLSREQ